MKYNEFTFYSDETPVITSLEQLAMHATFIMNGEIKEHFIGLIPISKVVGTQIMSAGEIFLKI